MGPLEGLKFIELAGIGPGQLAGMLLADMGAQVLRIDRLGDPGAGVAIPPRFNLMNRSRPAIALDLKHPDGVALVLDLCAQADALFEGYRPGVMERLGLGPQECLDRNPRLVYGRMTGWGQTGPLAGSAGHDSNYVALAGALGAIGEADRPPPIPLNLIGDFGGGALYLTMGMLAALLEASRSGQGQVVDAAMVDGTASMLTLFNGLLAGGLWRDRRASNLLDGGAPFARSYATRDDRFIVVCAIENRFFAALLAALEITEIDPAEQYDQAHWPSQVAILERTFRSRTRDEWSALLEGTDTCFAPVLSLAESPSHPHNAARGTFVEVDGIVQPAPAPRFSRTRSEIGRPPATPGVDDRTALAAWGVSERRIARLVEAGVVGTSAPADP